MISGSDNASMQLLRDLEIRHGRYRLDLAPFRAEHGDADWDKKVFGGANDILQEKGKTASSALRMFDNAILMKMAKASEVLLGDKWTEVEHIPLGMTSIPIVNACAIRSCQAMATAFNSRLMNVLTILNAIDYDLGNAIMDSHLDSFRDAAQRMTFLMQGANLSEFDRIISEVNAFPTFYHFRYGSALSMIQHLFVGLHEYGHMLLGHFDDDRQWTGHPLTVEEMELFTGSQDNEFEADLFAVRTIFPPLQGDALSVLIDLTDAGAFGTTLVAQKLVLLFACLHSMSPLARPSYYKVPRDHPHPYDRALRVVEAIEGSSMVPERHLSSLRKHMTFYFNMGGSDISGE